MSIYKMSFMLFPLLRLFFFFYVFALASVSLSSVCPSAVALPNPAAHLSCTDHKPQQHNKLDGRGGLRRPPSPTDSRQEQQMSHWRGGSRESACETAAPQGRKVTLRLIAF